MRNESQEDKGSYRIVSTTAKCVIVIGAQPVTDPGSSKLGRCQKGIRVYAGIPGNQDSLERSFHI